MIEASRRFFLFGAGAAIAAGSVGPAFLPEISRPEDWVEGPRHPAMAKAWAMFDGQAGVIDCYNISGIERAGLGEYTLRFKDGLFGLQPLCMAMADKGMTGVFDCSCEKVLIKTYDESGTLADPGRASVIIFGT